MGEYLPLLIGAAYVIYKFYNNFKEEQEKAQKRNPSQHAPVPAEQRTYEQHPQRAEPYSASPKQPEPFLVEETYNPRHPYEPAYREVYQEPAYKEPAYETVYKTPPQSITKKAVGKSIPKTIRLTEFEEAGSHHREVNEPVYQFDIRDAIIKEAILRRSRYAIQED